MDFDSDDEAQGAKDATDVCNDAGDMTDASDSDYVPVPEVDSDSDSELDSDPDATPDRRESYLNSAFFRGDSDYDSEEFEDSD